jgi:hypothetical protein
LEISTSASFELANNNKITIAPEEIGSNDKDNREDEQLVLSYISGKFSKSIKALTIGRGYNFAKCPKDKLNNIKVLNRRTTNRFLVNEGSILKEDFRDQLLNLKSMYCDLSVSLDRPYIATYVETGNGEVFDSDGYIEEEDAEEFKNTSFDVVLINQPDDLPVIKSIEELNEVLYGNGINRDDRYPSLIVDSQEVILDTNNHDIEVIKPEQFYLILRFVYDELNPILIELSDNFVDERRKYFLTDTETYINIISSYIEKRDEIFVSIISGIMQKLKISQEILDNSFFYYLYHADATTKFVNLIREAYKNIYHAGVN